MQLSDVSMIERSSYVKVQSPSCVREKALKQYDLGLERRTEVAYACVNALRKALF